MSKLLGGIALGGLALALTACSTISSSPRRGETPPIFAAASGPELPPPPPSAAFAARTSLPDETTIAADRITASPGTPLRNLPRAETVSQASTTLASAPTEPLDLALPVRKGQ